MKTSPWQCVQPIKTASYVTVPKIIDIVPGISMELIPWVEPQRLRQELLVGPHFVLEYDPNSAKHYVFPRHGSFKVIIILVKPGVPVPPGFFNGRQDCPTIIRHEIPYCFFPTAPIPGNLTMAKAPKKCGVWYEEYTLADGCPSYYLSAKSHVIISEHNENGSYTSSRYSLLLPSLRGKVKT